MLCISELNTLSSVSTMEMLHDCVLYKYTIDIDIMFLALHVTL